MSHQVLQVKVGDSKPAYMAIASAPAAKGSEIELLVKNQGPTAELLCSVKEGAPACTLARNVRVSRCCSLSVQLRVCATACQRPVARKLTSWSMARRCCGREPRDWQRLSS